MKKRTTKIFLSLAGVVALTACILVTTAARTASTQEIDEIRDAIIGAKETLVQMGMYTSEDGLTSSLTEDELEAIATAYDQKVDRYYAQGTHSNTAYKWLNREYLFNTYQTVLDNCLEGGVSQCDITEINISDDGTEATVKATVTMWNKWVTLDDEGKYVATNPVNQDFMELKMVKEDGLWKLQETLSFERGPFGHDPEILTEANGAEPVALAANTEETEILEEIQRSEEILNQKYDSFQAAKAAVEQIDVEKGNYLALLG